MARVAAAILIVGDEILSGHTQDTNSHYLAQRLRSRGIPVGRIVACSDRIEDVADRITELLAARFRYVFVCGGIGPTPDDRTYEAVATAASLPLVLDPADAQWMRERVARTGYGRELLEDEAGSEALWRMVRRPEGSRRIGNPVGAALGSFVEIGETGLIVLPGVPRELRAMMEQEVEPLLSGGPGEDAAEIEVRGEEAALWSILRDAEARFQDVRIGSYPQDDKGRIVLRLQGTPEGVRTAEAFLRQAVQRLSGSGSARAPRLI